MSNQIIRMLVACLLFVQTVAVVSAVEEDYPSGSLESIGLFASPEVGVRDVEDWQIFSEMNILPGAFCKDEFFNLLYAAMDVVVVFQPQFSTETNQTLLGFVRNVSLGNRYATDCFFKSAEELYMSTIPQKQSDKYSEEEALTIVFAVFNRVSGTFLRFENYSMNFPVFTPLQETTTTDSGSESTLSDSSPQSSGEASSSSGSSSSSQSEASSASGSGSDTSSSGEGSDSGEQNSGLYNYLGKPVTGSNSRILCLFPYRFGQYVSLYYGSKTGTSRLQISSANTPFSTIREFYKRQENSTNLYILGFYSVEELSVDTFDIIVVVDDNIPENTPDIPIPVNPPEEGSVPSDIKAYYSYAAVYREALLTVCAACVPITFLATEDNAGVVMLLKDQQEQSIRVAFLPYVAGAGVVPGDSSTSEPSYGPIPPITMVTLFDDIRTITTFVEDYVTGGLYITATCSLQCSVVARVQRDGSTLYDPTVKIVWPIGVQKGTKFSSLLIDDSTRTISYITPCSGSLCIYEVALFGIEQPVTNLDVHRSTNMTVTGFGFTKDMLCVFPDAGVTTTAYVTNTTSLLCSVPLMGNLSCSEHPFRLKVDGVSGYSGKDVVAGMGYVSQFSTPRVFSVTNNITGGSYGSLEAATLTVEGYGFLSPTIAQKQTCRLNTNSSEGMEDQTVYMPARYISQSRIECDLPALPHLLPSPVYVEVAIDNVTFSYVREEYVTYGTPETIFSVVENQTLGYVSTIRADTLVAIPPVVVYLIDSVGHYLTVTQDAKYEAVIIRASVLSVETNQSFDERQKESILVGTTQMSMTAGGSVTFSNLNFSCPPQGQIVLLFTVINPGTIPSLKDKTCVKVVIVEEGSPHHLSFSTPPSATVTPTVGLLKQQPVIGVCDVCNNTFRSIELGQIGNLNVTVEREAPEKNVTFLVDPTNNMFYAEGIEIKGVHGKSYLVSFKATIGDYPELVSSPILVTECDRSELAVMSNSSCLPCPLHAVCDGSHIVLAEEGWWRTGPNTFTFMECYPPQGVNACLSNGSCAVGYGGVRCSECLAGYRAANGECQKCPNAATSDFLSFLIILFFVVFLTVWIHLMTVLDPQSPHVGSVKGVINVIQLLGLFSLIRVKWPRVLFNFLQGLHNMTNLLDYVLTCTYDKHTGYIILLFIAPVGFVMVSTLVVRFLAVGLRRGRIDPAPMAAMLMVSYTHRRRRKMVEILDRIISSYKAHALPNESVEAYVDRMSHPSISTIAPRSFRFLSALVQTNSVVGNSASRLDNVSSHSHNRTSTQPERQSADGPNRPRLVATALPSTTTQFEDILIQCFESASGATEGDRIVYLLANQDTTVLRAVSEMQLVLPTKAVMADWVRTSRENESPALGRRAKASTEEALHRKYIKSTIQELPARVGHGVEESYRYQAIMQFRKSWIGILLNSIATVTFVFQFVFVATALTWQNCETLVEDGSVVTKYYTYHSTLQCDDPRYKPLRSAGIALLILYGVVLPLILLLVSVLYRRRYGTDVMYAAFPVLYFNTRESLFWPEFYNFFEKLLCCVGVILGHSPLMQVASAILIYLFRFVVFGCLKNRVEYGSAPPVITFLSGKATMIASITHFVMANILLLIAYLILYVENVSREVESFLSALVIIGFSILVLLYVLLCIRDIISRLVHCKRDREKGGRKASAIQQKIRVMAHIYNEISRSIYDYLRLCEGGFKIAQQLDEMAVTHRRRMDGTIFSSSSSASSDDMVPFGGGDRNTLMMQFRRPSSDDDSLMSDMDVMHTGLSGGMRFRDEENSFLKDWHTLDEPDMVVPTDNANWLTKEDVASAQPPGEGDLITSKDGESAGSGEYQSVPFPVHQPTLNRCPSMRFSIRNVKKTPADDTAKQGDEETTLGHSSGKAADSIPPPATPPPALPPDTLAMSLNALLASDPVDVASHFDPMAVPPLPVVKPKSKPPQNAQDILKEVRDASPPEMNSGWQSAPGLDLLASLRGVDSEEARSLLHMLQLAPPAGTSAGNETDVAATHGETPAAAKDTTNAQSEHKASEATDTVPDPEVEKPQLPPPLPVFSRPELPKSDRHSRAKQKQKLARKKEKERRKENASGPPPERKKGGEDADTNRKRR